MIQLDLFAPRKRLTDAPAVLAARLLAYLELHGTWRTRADALRDIGMPDRDCRAAREASGEQIIFGQRGFKAMSCATRAEAFECAATLDSQGDNLKAQAARIRCAASNKEADEIEAAHG